MLFSRTEKKAIEKPQRNGERKNEETKKKVLSEDFNSGKPLELGLSEMIKPVRAAQRKQEEQRQPMRFICSSQSYT